jgi:L-threonylcarbamoyladenylate synthase
VYGLGADATNPDAVAKIFAAKGRPASHPLIVHAASADEALRWAAEVPESAIKLATACWPGPLTLVLRRHPQLPSAASGGYDTVGLRVPDHPLALDLLARVAIPVAAPSANRFGRVSPTTAADVAAELGDLVDLILDGGPSAVGVESTIVDLVGARPTLLRPGGVPVELIEAILETAVERDDVGPARASGMLPSHYAPTCRVQLVAAGEVDACVEQLRGAGLVVAVLPRGASVVEDARQLYRHLRDADAAGVDVLVATPPEPHGLGLAVADRLRRAAAPRASAGN